MDFGVAEDVLLGEVLKEPVETVTEETDKDVMKSW